MDEHHQVYIHVSQVLGHIFKDNEGIYIYVMHISTIYSYYVHDLNTSTLLVLFKSVDLFYE